MIHSTAIVSPKARLGHNVRIGPYSIIGDDVEIGDDCVLHSHVVMEGITTIGRNNEFFPFSIIGGKTQDLKYKGEPTYLVIGDNNVFRENVTIHRSTFGEEPTRIGSNNHFLSYSHVAHDCQLGNHIILSNSVALAGHVIVEDHAIVSGVTAIHQFCRIGEHSIIGGCSRVTQDIPPFTMAVGNPGETRGLNLIGLQRRGFTDDDIRHLKTAYKKVLFKKDANLAQAIASFREHASAQNPHVRRLLDFIENSERGITR
ncbi:MAG: acyl-ACP--UDP-N-acetylglucosamine O-acyltransferase [Luteolibacter sp.]